MYLYIYTYSTLMSFIKRDSVTRFSSFFHESVFPEPQSIPLGPFRTDLYRYLLSSPHWKLMYTYTYFYLKRHCHDIFAFRFFS
jgi:hypothetical protein